MCGSNGSVLISSYWLGRFQVFDQGGFLYFRDFLQPAGRFLESELFQSSCGQHSCDLAFFEKGLLRGAYSSAFIKVESSLVDASSVLFWQYPCCTEAVAWANHDVLSSPVLRQYVMNIYLGLPWATWIDKEGQMAWGESGKKQMELQVRLLKVRLSGINYALSELRVKLRVHTVCQHIHWRNFLPIWEILGVTDLWLSHCPASDALTTNIRLHPWHLFAVNVEDSQRNVDIEIARDPAEKKTLASFVGAYMPHYLGDIRLQLRQFEEEEGFVIKVKEKWHFDDVVYQHQMNGQPLQENYQIDDSVADYNALLSDSVFSLCPAGAGPNTLRLWESLAVGAIPVMLGDRVRLPEGGNLERIDWESVVLRIEDDQLQELPVILRAMSLEERRRRQRACLDAYAKVKAQQCF